MSDWRNDISGLMSVQEAFDLTMADVALAMGRDVEVREREMLAWVFNAGRTWELGPVYSGGMELVR